MSSLCRGGLVGALAAVLLVPSVRADIDAAQVLGSLDRGRDYLLREQQADGTWADMTGFPGGVSALSTLSLISAGVPVDDARIQSALASLRKVPPSKTYCVALQTMVFAEAEPKRDLAIIERNVRWLEQQQITEGNNRGAWSYPGATGDNSNSQFALLALHEAERVGVDVHEETWRLAADYWKRIQNPDGSWGYLPGMPGRGSMTSAGIAGLVITLGRMTTGDASVVDGQVRCCGESSDDDALGRALAWMGRHFSAERNPGARGLGGTWFYYYLYGIERTGRMTAQRLLGEHDWYREGAEKLIREQDSLSGYWKGVGHAEDHPHIATSLALLFLAKGRRPVVVSKLQHGRGDDWNHHRNDLASLTAYTERRWERDLTWQIIHSANASVEDLLQTPVLFFNGRLEPQLSTAEKERLRAYIDRGGFLFAEACCRGTDFDRGFRSLMQEIFPEPEYALRPLPPEHPVWRAEEPVDAKYVRPLWGIEYGCRTSVVYSPEDLSCYWELGRAGRNVEWPADVAAQVGAAHSIGVNVLTYATGRQPQYKEALFDTVLVASQNGDHQRGRLAVAKLLHPGGCQAAPGALMNLLRAAASQLQLRIDVADHEIPITDPSLFRYHLTFMHGRQPFRLTQAERDQLALFVERGGTLLADAVCASPPFADSFRREMSAIFPDKSLQRIPVSDVLFTSQLGGYDIRQVERRDPQEQSGQKPMRARIRKVEPHLEGIEMAGRFGVIFSPYDLSCALEKHPSLECQGYTEQDAARIGLNIILYSLHP
jgi:hypothetical protein